VYHSPAAQKSQFPSLPDSTFPFMAEPVGIYIPLHLYFDVAKNITASYGGNDIAQVS
jgi:hypothetical protein